MKIISTRLHAVLDYAIILVTLLSPRLFRLMDSDGAAVWIIPCLVGLVQFNISIITGYEGGIFARIPMRVHLSIDRVLGLFLAASPWLFDFSRFAYLPHLSLGTALFLIALMTRNKPLRKRMWRRNPFFYRKRKSSARYHREERVEGL